MRTFRFSQEEDIRLSRCSLRRQRHVLSPGDITKSQWWGGGGGGGQPSQRRIAIAGQASQLLALLVGQFANSRCVCRARGKTEILSDLNQTQPLSRVDLASAPTRLMKNESGTECQDRSGISELSGRRTI